MTNGAFAVRAGVVTPEETLEQGVVLVENGRIKEVRRDLAADFAGTVVDGGPGSLLLPGFIDVHVHGGNGHDFMEANAEAFDAITAFHGRHGTTTMLATTVTAPKADLDRVLEAVAQYQHRQPSGAKLAGAHIEGPFISPKWPGAQNPAYIVPPNVDWVKDWVSRFPGVVKQVTLAPEREGALEVISWLASRGIIAACGHTDAKYDEIMTAVDHGLTQAVHTFNAMRGLHHREPGTVGAVLTDDRIRAEVIADGHHVHPAAIRLLTQTKRNRNLLLITDAISAAGLGDGDYTLGGLDVVVKDGVARLKEGDSLAGSTLTMIDAFRFMVRRIGLGVAETSRMASLYPAMQLGIDGETGSIEPGKKADLVLVDADLRIRQVWVEGRSIHADAGR